MGLLGTLFFEKTDIKQSSLTSDEQINVEETTATSEPTTTEASVDPFYSEILTANGKKPAVPLGNGRGVAVVEDAIVTLHGESGTIYASRHQNIDGEAIVTSVMLDDSFANVNPSALSGVGSTVAATWMATDGLSTSLSDDNGETWSEPFVHAPRPTGSATPSSCAWIDSDNQPHAIVVWTAPPVTGDGGYLYLSEWTDGTWSDPERVGTNELASSPSLACRDKGQMMVLRDGEIKNLNVFLTIRNDDGSWPDPKKVFKGADPHMAWCGNRIWIGYHSIGAFRAYSDDGGDSWEKETISTTGKFGAITCDEKTVAITPGETLKTWLLRRTKMNQNEKSEP